MHKNNKKSDRGMILQQKNKKRNNYQQLKTSLNEVLANKKSHCYTSMD